jgi:hypothetical protein
MQPVRDGIYGPKVLTGNILRAKYTVFLKGLKIKVDNFIGTKYYIFKPNV